MNPAVPAPQLPPHIQGVKDPRRTGAKRAGAARTSYACTVCGGTYHAFRCVDIPYKSSERFTWARRELERWQAGAPPDAPEWFWSMRVAGRVVGPRGRRSLLWYLKVYKLTMFLYAHQPCAGGDPTDLEAEENADFDADTWIRTLEALHALGS